MSSAKLSSFDPSGLLMFGLQTTIAMIVVVADCNHDAFAVSQENVQLVDGRQFDARLTSIDSNWNLRLNSEERQFVIRLDELIRFGRYEGDSGDPLIIFRNGDILSAEVTGIDALGVEIASRYWQKQKIPLEYIRAVLLQPAWDPWERDRQIVRLMNREMDQDRVTMRNEDIWEGEIETGESQSESSTPAFDWLPEPFKSVSVQIASESIRLNATGIYSIEWASRASERDAPRLQSRAKIGFKDGSFLHCQRVRQSRDRISFQIAPGQMLDLNTTFGRDIAWEQIAFIETVGERSRYLSELKPLAYQPREVHGIEWPFTRNHSVVGTRLRHRGQIFVSGIGMHTDSTLAFAVPNGAEKLLGRIALDDTAGRSAEDLPNLEDRSSLGFVGAEYHVQQTVIGGSVVFRVFGSQDGSNWSKLYESDLVRAGEPAIPLELEIGDFRFLSLSVGRSDDGWVLDRANWLNLRFE